MNIKLKGTEVGDLSIGEGAVRSVVDLAIQDMGDGTTKINQRLLLGSAMRIKEGKDNNLIVDLELNMPYDAFLPDAMREVQMSVKKALVAHLGIENAVVNVSVTKLSTAEDAATTVATAEAAMSKVAAAGAAVTKATVTKIAAMGSVLKSS